MGHIRPEQTFCLKDTSVIIKPKFLVEAPVLDPGTNDLGLSVSFHVSTGKIEENTTCAPEYFSHLPRALKSHLINFL